MNNQQTIFGINAVSVRLSAGGDGVHKLLLREGDLGKRLAEMERIATSRGLPIERIPESEFARMSGVVHQGVGLVVDPMRYLDEDALMSLVESATTPLLLLVLDGITDPRNFGACLRSAATLGVDAVVVTKDRSAPLDAAAIKTASGGAAIVPVVRVVNLARCLGALKRSGIWVVGTQLEASEPLYDIDLTGNIAIVMGAEGAGLRRNTVAQCDFLARIPMIVDDLGFNISVAAGICLYEARRQRRTHS